MDLSEFPEQPSREELYRTDGWHSHEWAVNHWATYMVGNKVLLYHDNQPAYWVELPEEVRYAGWGSGNPGRPEYLRYDAPHKANAYFIYRFFDPAQVELWDGGAYGWAFGEPDGNARLVGNKNGTPVKGAKLVIAARVIRSGGRRG